MKRCWVKQSGWRIAAPPILLRYFIPADTGRCGIWPDPVNAALLEEFVAQDKPVAAVCHGPAALLAARMPDGSALVRGRKVTGFSDSEEILVGLNRIVPFLLEDRLRKLSAEYRKGGDWSEFAIADGKLVTGQNPQSAGKTAELLLKLLR